MTFRKTETENNFEYLIRLGLYGFVGILIVYRLCIVFSFKHELVNGESNNLWNAMNVSHGKPIYSNPEALPLEVFQYTPLSQFPLIAYAYALNDSSPYYLYWLTVLGRLTSLIANLLTVGLLFRLLRCVYQVSRQIAFATSVLCLVTLTHATFAIRPDALTILITTALSVGIFESIHQNKFKRVVLFSGLTAIAVFFKQDAFFLLAPVGLFLIIEEKWFYLVGSVVAFLGGLFICLALGHLLFGPYFLYSVTKGIQNPGSLSQAINVFDKAISLFGSQLLIGITLVCYYFIQKQRQRMVLLVCLFVMCYAGLGFLSSFKLGSWVNYYTPCILWSSVVLAIYSSKIQDEAIFISLSLVVGSIFWFRQTYFYTMPYVKSLREKKLYEEKYTTCQQLRKELRLTKHSNVLVSDQLLRNFLFEQSIMVNTEYYGISNFDYTNFKSQREKYVEFIIFDNQTFPISKMCMDKFNMHLEKYSEFYKVDDLVVMRIRNF